MEHIFNSICNSASFSIGWISETLLALAEWSAAELSEPRYLSNTCTWRALFHIIRGELSAAEESLQAGLDVWSGNVSSDATGANLTVSAVLQQLREEVDELVSTMAYLVAQRPDLIVFRATQALLLAEFGRHDEAGRDLDGCLAKIGQPAFRDVT